MKAIIYTSYGQPEVLTIQDIEKPNPADNEILVKVMATTVNRTDCANLTANPFIMRFSLGLFMPKKQIPGTEFSGVVEKIGTAVTRFKPGDRIFGFDDMVLGSYAEYASINENKGIAIMPAGLSFSQAAASTEGFHYAYNFVNKVPLKAGDKVLINGASGGIGSAALQILKYHGAIVTAVCDTKSLTTIKSMGADKVIDYLNEDFTEDDEQYDYVFDTVGKSTFGKCKKILKPGGTYISSELGPFIQNIFYSITTIIFGKMPLQGGRKVKFPYPPNILESVQFIKKLIEAGKYTALIDRTYKMEEISEAFRYVLQGQKTGNVVITINDPT